MAQFAVILLIIAYAAGAFLVNRHYIHVFQLSSYQFEGYFRTLAKDARALLLPASAVLLYFALNVQTAPAFLKWATLIPMLIVIFLYRPKAAKKKLVITDRVKRLILTICVLTGLIAVLPWVMWHFADYRSVSGKLLAIYYGALPIVTAFAGGVNAQDEKKINQRFINEAGGLLSSMPDLRIVGITGSYGKTSMKYALSTILSEKFNVLMTPESWNTPMGITRCVREQLKPVHEVFVCEMGARHPDDIGEITRFVHPDDGILTAVGEQHLETFRSMDNILRAKTDLLRAVGEKHPALEREKEKADGKGALEPKGIKLVNGDNELLSGYMKADYVFHDIVTYGLNEGNAYRAVDITTSLNGTGFAVVCPDGERIDCETSLVGAHNVLNLTGAVAYASMCGMSAREISRGLKRVMSVPHRLELKKNGRVSILDDAYNANPAGAKAALETLGMFSSGKKILVTPGMVELGDRQAELNRALGEQAATVCDEIIIVNEVNAEAIREGVLSSGAFDAGRLHLCKTFEEAQKLMYGLAGAEETVILLLNDLPDQYK